MRLGRNQAMMLRNNFMGTTSFLFCSMSWQYDMKSSQISSAYNIWLSRYRPSNLMLTTEFVLVLVFVNFLWAVYITPFIAVTTYISATIIVLSVPKTKTMYVHSNFFSDCIKSKRYFYYTFASHMRSLFHYKLCVNWKLHRTSGGCFKLQNAKTEGRTVRYEKS